MMNMNVNNLDTNYLQSVNSHFDLNGSQHSDSNIIEDDLEHREEEATTSSQLNTQLNNRSRLNLPVQSVQPYIETVLSGTITNMEIKDCAYQKLIIGFKRTLMLPGKYISFFY